MKLGYLSIPVDSDQARILGGAASACGRAHLAQSLGFTEFYETRPYLKPGCTTDDGCVLEHAKCVRILQRVPQRPGPKLIAADGQIHRIDKAIPYNLAAPVQTVQDVQDQASQGNTPLSVSWLDTDTLARHWSAYVAGCTHASRIARPADWRVARTIMVCHDGARAEAAVKDSQSPCRAYYRNLLPCSADDSAVDALIDACVLYGTRQPSWRVCKRSSRHRWALAR
jgi:hypothetical protein